jgi:DNA replication and repair protein RecF
MEIRVNGFPARDRVSRGQQKLVAASLILAQLELLQRSSARVGTLLLDDPAAELDAGHLQALMAHVAGLGPQLVVTATASSVEALQEPGARFHVEQGVVTRML